MVSSVEKNGLLGEKNKRKQLRLVALRKPSLRQWPWALTSPEHLEEPPVGPERAGDVSVVMEGEVGVCARPHHASGVQEVNF